MSQGRMVVEQLREATRVVVDVENHLTIKLGTQPEVRVESNQPISVTRSRSGVRLTVTDTIAGTQSGIIASGPGSVAMGTISNSVILTGSHSRPPAEPAISPTPSVHGAILTVPEGVEVVVETAHTLTVEPAAQAAVRVVDNR